MNKYHILDIAIKIMGLTMVPLLFTNLFQQLVYTIGMLNFYENNNYDINNDLGLTSLIIAIGVFLIYIFIIYFFIFKTAIILKWILKNADLEKSVIINSEKKQILEMAIIIIGGLGLVDAIPSLVMHIDYYLQIKKAVTQIETVSNNYFFFDITQIICCIFLISYSRPLAVFFIKKQSRPQEIDVNKTSAEKLNE